MDKPNHARSIEKVDRNSRFEALANLCETSASSGWILKKKLALSSQGFVCGGLSELEVSGSQDFQDVEAGGAGGATGSRSGDLTAAGNVTGALGTAAAVGGSSLAGDQTGISDVAVAEIEAVTSNIVPSRGIPQAVSVRAGAHSHEPPLGETCVALDFRTLIIQDVHFLVQRSSCNRPSCYTSW